MADVLVRRLNLPESALPIIRRRSTGRRQLVDRPARACSPMTEIAYASA
jgi:hypothetical protein